MHTSERDNALSQLARRAGERLPATATIAHGRRMARGDDHGDMRALSTGGRYGAGRRMVLSKLDTIRSVQTCGSTETWHGTWPKMQSAIL